MKYTASSNSFVDISQVIHFRKCLYTENAVLKSERDTCHPSFLVKYSTDGLFAIDTFHAMVTLEMQSIDSINRIA